jgi:hypothetical protein
VDLDPIALVGILLLQFALPLLFPSLGLANSSAGWAGRVRAAGRLARLG